MAEISGDTLLTRLEFEERVLNRDKNRCVVCAAPAVRAYHILDATIWQDGGHYLDNGVSLCGTCNRDAEMGNLSCEELRGYAKIEIAMVPDGLWTDIAYDRWGRPLEDVDFVGVII